MAAIDEATNLCEEWNGAHDMRLRTDEIGSAPEVVCGYGCGRDLDDFYPDGAQMLEYDIPITVFTETIRYRGTWGGDEYDSRVWVEERHDG